MSNILYSSLNILFIVCLCWTISGSKDFCLICSQLNPQDLKIYDKRSTNMCSVNELYHLILSTNVWSKFCCIHSQIEKISLEMLSDLPQVTLTAIDLSLAWSFTAGHHYAVSPATIPSLLKSVAFRFSPTTLLIIASPFHTNSYRLKLTAFLP